MKYNLPPSYEQVVTSNNDDFNNTYDNCYYLDQLFNVYFIYFLNGWIKLIELTLQQGKFTKWLLISSP